MFISDTLSTARPDLSERAFGVRSFVLPAAVVSAFAFSARDASAQCGTQEVIELHASDAAANDFFGHGVALSGDTAIVGGYANDDGGSGSGSAYVYYRDAGGPDQWGEIKKLVASDAQAGDIFGFTLTLSGDTAVISASSDDDQGLNAGAVYVFERNLGGADNWGEVIKITPFDGAPGDRFGLSLVVSGDTLLVGSHLDDDLGNESGSVYVYDRNLGGPDNWGFVKKLVASDGVARDFFGKAVRVSGDTALIGANGVDDNGADSGAVYVFERNLGGPDNWGEVLKLTASDGLAGDAFGETVAISGDTAIVTSVASDEIGSSSGSAYVFERNVGGADNWGEVKKITASDAGDGDRFGESVALVGDVAVLGALNDDDLGLDAGAFYVLHRDFGGASNWGEVAKLTASDGMPGDWYGSFVALSGKTALVGSFNHDDNFSNAGSAYVVDLSVAPAPDTYCTAQINSLGCLPFLTSTGTPSASAGSGFIIHANDVLPGKAGLLLYSVHGPGGAPFLGGFLCATPPTRRTAVVLAAASGTGTTCPTADVGQTTFDFNVRIANGLDPTLVFGQEVWSQYWLRDSADPSGTSLTDGLHFTICY